MGQTGDAFARMKQYPKGSRLMFFVEWDVEEPVGLVTLETVVLGMLRASPEVTQRRDLGSEYFECDMGIIVSTILEMRKRLSAAPGGGGEVPDVPDVPDVPGGNAGGTQRFGQTKFVAL